jgi:8-amino-7-oxononanoate synthase
MAELPANAWAQEDLDALSRRGLRRSLETLQTPQGVDVVIDGERLVSFCSNDYLGLAADPRVQKRAAEALERYGVGAGASRLVVGGLEAHRSLERACAAFMGTPAALAFNSGYAANLGILQSLCGPEDVIFSDELNHASLVDGCRLSRATVVVYPHADVSALDALMSQHPGRRALVCTDAVFSMDGDWAPLRALVELCQARGAALMVDEAHALGVLGTRGRGLCEALGVESSVDLRMGTLGKALGGFGAFAATSPQVAELLFNRARSFVFSTALPPSVCAAAEAAFEIIASDPSLRFRLRRNILHLSEGFRALGIPAHGASAIVPWVLGEPQRALDAASALRARGLLVKPIRPPTVPVDTSRLRFALSAAHTEAQIDRALDAVAELQKVRVAA